MQFQSYHDQDQQQSQAQGFYHSVGEINNNTDQQYHSSNFFQQQPLHSELMSESCLLTDDEDDGDCVFGRCHDDGDDDDDDEFNEEILELQSHNNIRSSIFRDVGNHSPPTIPRANPICCMEEDDDDYECNDYHFEEQDGECDDDILYHTYHLHHDMQPQQQQQQQQQLGGETAFFKISNNHTTASSTVAPCSLPFSPIPITPYPYSPCQQELEDRKQYPLPEVVDYSCYFQPLPDQDQKPELFSSPNRSCEEMNNESHAHAHRTLLQQDQQHMRLTSSPAQISDTDSMEELDTDF